jgi:hypothetical protein
MLHGRARLYKQYEAFEEIAILLFMSWSVNSHRLFVASQFDLLKCCN